MNALIQKLASGQALELDEFEQLIRQRETVRDKLADMARAVRKEVYGDRVWIRGLIEFTSWCKNDCRYCGLRCSNQKAQRYRLTEDEILSCCRKGYRAGFRTFVLQGGEDPLYPSDRIASLVTSIKKELSDCVVTLSVGEQPREVYERWYEAGADRSLLRHETADEAHSGFLHPEGMSFSDRMRCLRDLKSIGYQVGCGFMVGSPGQTEAQLAKDLQFLQQFRPHMVGIGPFVPQKDTPFGDRPGGTVEMTTFLLSVIRVMLPDVLLPSTTALATIHPDGREQGIRSGANVCMPNLSPMDVRGKYTIYDNKACAGDEAAEQLLGLEEKIRAAGCQMSMGRGDHSSKSGG